MDTASQSRNRFGFFLQRCDQAVRVIAHDARDSRLDQHPHMSGMVDGPADHLQIFFVRLLKQRRSNQIAAHHQLARANFQGFLDGLFHLSVVKQSRHYRGLDFADVQDQGRVKRDGDGAGNFPGLTQRADQSVLSSPRTARLQFQVKHDVVLFRELKDFLEGRNTLAGKSAAEPGARIQVSQFREREFVHRAFSVGGAVHRRIVDGDEMRVARQLQIRLDKRRAQSYGFAERRQSILRRVSRCSAMGDHQHPCFFSVLKTTRRNTASAEKFLSWKNFSEEPPCKHHVSIQIADPSVQLFSVRFESNYSGARKEVSSRRKTMRKEMRALFVALALTAASAMAAYPAAGLPQENKHQRSEAKYEARLAKEVRHELVMLPYYSVFDNLAFQVNGDKVILLGQVTRPTLKSDAEGVVKGIEGVASVTNKIEVLPLSPMDDQLRRALFRAIYSEAGLQRYGNMAVPSIHIIVSNGNVTLEGVVDNEMDKNLANIRANQVPNVFSVKNNLVVVKS